MGEGTILRVVSATFKASISALRLHAVVVAHKRSKLRRYGGFGAFALRLLPISVPAALEFSVPTFLHQEVAGVEHRLLLARCDIDQMQRPGVLAQRAANPFQNGWKERFGAGIVEEEDRGLRREDGVQKVDADGFDRLASIRAAPVFPDVLLRDRVKLGRELEADDAPKREVRRHQQRAALARSEVDEREVFVLDRNVQQRNREAFRIDGRIVDALQPVSAGDVEVAEVRPAPVIAIGLHPVPGVELAAWRRWYRDLRRPVLTEEVNGQQHAAGKARRDAALRDGRANAGKNGTKYAGHDRAPGLSALQPGRCYVRAIHLMGTAFADDGERDAPAD